MSGNFYVYFVEFQTQNLLLEAVRCHCLPQMMQNTRISTRRRLYEGRGWGGTERRGEINCLCSLHSCSKQGVSLRGLSFQGKKKHIC